MKVLLTTDGSEYSLAALRAFVARLNWFRQLPEIALLTVHPALPYGRAAAWAGKDAVTHYYDDEMTAILAPAAAILAEHKLEATQIRRVGEPAREIVKFADEWGADLIIMGRHGQSGMVSLLLGSVAQKVLASTAIPALLLK
jgi:nucleotide-binding universal stress UspA family protein